jgi:hypothetical protein
VCVTSWCAAVGVLGAARAEVDPDATLPQLQEAAAAIDDPGSAGVR